MANSPIYIAQDFKTLPDDDRRIFYCDLTKSTGLDGGVVTGALDHNANGASNNGDSYIRWTPSAAQKAALEKNYHIRIEIEDGHGSNHTAFAQRILTLGAGPQKLYLGNAAGIIVTQLDQIAETIGGRIVHSGGETAHAVYDFIGIGGYHAVYKDGLLIHENAGGTAPNFTSITLFASNGGTEIWGANSGANSRIKSFSAYASLPILVSHRYMSNITLLGDSLTQQGNLETGYPQHNGGVGSGDFNDYSLTATIYSELGKRGIKTQVYNRGVSGDTVAQLLTLIQSLPSNAFVNHTVFVGIGTNNVQLGALTAGYETDLQLCVDEITSRGANHIFIRNITSTAEDATSPDSQTATAVDDANTAVDNVVAANANCTLNDIFTLFGRHNFKVDYYQSLNLHWSRAGSRVVGMSDINKILTHYGII